MGARALLLMLASGVCWGAPAAGGQFTATAYTVEGETASGAIARKGMVAADPDILPLGTTIRISGAGRYSGVYTVADTGRKISGREIDIYIANNAEAKKFGKQKVRVKVLKKAPLSK